MCSKVQTELFEKPCRLPPMCSQQTWYLHVPIVCNNIIHQEELLVLTFSSTSFGNTLQLSLWHKKENVTSKYASKAPVGWTFVYETTSLGKNHLRYKDKEVASLLRDTCWLQNRKCCDRKLMSQPFLLRINMLQASSEEWRLGSWLSQFFYCAVCPTPLQRKVSWGAVLVARYSKGA